MKLSFLKIHLLIALCASCHAGFAQQTSNAAVKPDAPEGLLQGDYKLNPDFSDEFEGGAVDAAKWYDFYPAWNGRAPGFFDRRNVSVQNGKLILTAKAAAPQEVSAENRAEGKDKFSTAAFRSKTRVLYGYFEIRFKSMQALVCNAFWLNDPIDPPAKYKLGERVEEIDIFEVFGKATSNLQKYKEGPLDKLYFTTIHRGATPYVESKVWLDHVSADKRTPVKEYFYEAYHTAGFLWTPEELVWIYDGQIVWRLKNEFCRRALYLNIDCEIMKNWVGEPDPADLPAQFTVEYVRVWQK